MVEIPFWSQSTLTLFRSKFDLSPLNQQLLSNYGEIFKNSEKIILKMMWNRYNYNSKTIDSYCSMSQFLNKKIVILPAIQSTQYKLINTLLKFRD